MYFILKYVEFMNPTQAKAAMLRRADMDHIFDSLDMNKQGKLAPRDIDESLEGRIWPGKTDAKLFISQSIILR